MKNSFIHFFSLLCFLALPSCKAQQTFSDAREMAKTMMHLYPDSIVVKKSGEKVAKRPARWDYEHGVLLKGFDRLHQQTGDVVYYEYMKKIIDHFVQSDGSIRTYSLLEYNIDHITPGRIVLALYAHTKEEKYKKAAAQLMEQLAWQPRTKEGGYWHKHRYPYQMWLDGVYMAEPFAAEYAKVFQQPDKFDDIINQFVWMEKHVRDDKTGLLYHAYDESRKQQWADPVTGRAPGFWARGMGWYGMALVDALDYLPTDHPRRGEVLSILQRFCEAIIKVQDQKSGVWYQVLDQETREGNYLEASASAMFTYTLAKATRLHYIDTRYKSFAQIAYRGLLKEFVTVDEQGFMHLNKVVSVGGLGGNPYRDGSFEYYISEPIRSDDLKGVGPFIQAAIEIELLTRK